MSKYNVIVNCNVKQSVVATTEFEKSAVVFNGKYEDDKFQTVAKTNYVLAMIGRDKLSTATSRDTLKTLT